MNDFINIFIWEIFNINTAFLHFIKYLFPRNIFRQTIYLRNNYYCQALSRI
nr:MAG TPA: hypothetical protein [Caudoviricetes sp.]